MIQLSTRQIRLVHDGRMLDAPATNRKAACSLFRYWARWLNDYSNCIGFRDAQKQRTLGFLCCPADPVGVTFHNNSERLAYMRERGREFDKLDAEFARRQAARIDAESDTECHGAGGTWTPDRQATHGASCN